MIKYYGGPGPLVLQAEGRPREEGVDARKHIPLCKGTKVSIRAKPANNVYLI